MAKQKQGTETVRADEAADQREELRVVEAPEQSEAEEQEEEEVERLTHWEASHRVVRQAMMDGGDTTLSELSHDADKLVIAGGGKSNFDRCWNAVYGVLQSMAEMELVEMTEEVSVHPLHRLPSTNGQK